MIIRKLTNEKTKYVTVRLAAEGGKIFENCLVRPVRCREIFNPKSQKNLDFFAKIGLRNLRNDLNSFAQNASQMRIAQDFAQKKLCFLHGENLKGIKSAGGHITFIKN